MPIKRLEKTRQLYCEHNYVSYVDEGWLVRICMYCNHTLNETNRKEVIGDVCPEPNECLT